MAKPLRLCKGCPGVNRALRGRMCPHLERNAKMQPVACTLKGLRVNLIGYRIMVVETREGWEGAANER